MKLNKLNTVSNVTFNRACQGRPFQKFKAATLLHGLGFLMGGMLTQLSLADTTEIEQHLDTGNTYSLPYVENTQPEVSYHQLVQVEIGDELISVKKPVSGKPNLNKGSKFVDPISGQEGTLSGRLIVEISEEGMAALRKSSAFKVVSYSEHTSLALVEPTYAALDKASKALKKHESVGRVLPEKRIMRYHPM